MRKNVLIGSRYFDDNRKIYKVIKVKNKDTFTLSTLDGKTKFTKTRKELDSELTLLTPNGYIIISVVDTMIPEKGLQKDVVVALYRSNKTGDEAKHNLPYAICRQNIINVFHQMSNPNMQYIHCGMSISLDTCPKNLNYDAVLACEDVHHNLAIAVYMDDNFDDIFGLFKHDRYDMILKPGTVNNINFTEGYCETLTQLLKQEDFFYDFHKAFNINEIDFELEFRDKENYLISLDQAEYFEKLFNVEIFDAYAIEFDYTIRLRDIKKDYFLIYSKPEEKLYVVIYTKGTFADKHIIADIKHMRKEAQRLNLNLTK